MARRPQHTNPRDNDHYGDRDRGWLHRVGMRRAISEIELAELPVK
jgi:hypothetical protein